MRINVLKAKLHQACVTHAELHYDGSCAIDQDLLDAAGIREFEQIDIYNIDNGERFTTYAILGERGSKVISVNGAAARKAAPGDRVIICSYANFDEEELKEFKPKLVYLNAGNEIIKTSFTIAPQAR